MATVNSIMVLNFLKEHYGSEFSKKEIADALGISIRAVTGTINAFSRPEKGYCVITREEVVEEAPETETRKAKTKVVKYHTLTEKGLAYDPVKEEEEKQAMKEAEKARKAAARAAAKESAKA